MNVARRGVGTALQSWRTYATAAYVPPASLENLQRRRELPPKPKPQSPTFYTARSAYYDEFNSLETALHHTRSALRALELHPLPDFARASLPPAYPAWKTKDMLTERFGGTVTMTRYRRFVALLDELQHYHTVATSAGCGEVAVAIQKVLQEYERENKDAILNRGKRKPVEFDEYGRSYTIGRRKESTARVWVIPVQTPPEPSVDASAQVPDSQQAPTEEPVPEAETTDVSPLLNPISLSESPKPPVGVTITNILINNTPLNQYFPSPAERERVVRPFKIAGLLGAFNVFAIVRGGGTTGQSGALSLGIAKALAAHVPDVEQVLRKAKLLRRDPRMVERKKTGLAKARKAYTWVKR